MNAYFDEFPFPGNAGDRYYRSDYYERVGLAIKLDLRWQQEMRSEDIRTFDDVAGELNAAFVHAHHPGHAA